jgi:hypothetical protein
MNAIAAWIVLGLAAGSVGAALRAAEEPPILLPPVWVTAERLQPFFLAANTPAATRIWLKASAGSANAAMYFGFRGAGAKDGDEVIRIAGRDVKNMQPGEALHTILGTFSGRGPGQLELEVQARGEAGPRKVTIDRFWSPSAQIRRNAPVPKSPPAAPKKE